MKRTAKAHWEGTLKEGKGHLTTQSGILNEQNYSYKTRFEEGVTGTNPEELLLAAHVGCFTMAVGAALTQQGLQPESLDTDGTLTLESGNITGIHLSIVGKVSGISAADFDAVVKEKEANCIVSRALSVPITSESKLL